MSEQGRVPKPSEKKSLWVSAVARICLQLGCLLKFVSKRLHRCFCKSQNANDDLSFSVELSLEMISKVSHLKIRANAQTVPEAPRQPISASKVFIHVNLINEDLLFKRQGDLKFRVNYEACMSSQVMGQMHL